MSSWGRQETQIAVVGLLLALLLGLLLSAMFGPGGGGPLVVFTLASLAAMGSFIFSGPFAQLPWYLRPAPVFLVPTAIIGVLALQVPSRGEVAANLLLQTALGGVCGLALALAGGPAKTSRMVHKQQAFVVFWFAVACAAVFMGAQGVPILQDNAEQARVDVAVTGSGYLRLSAYMVVPAAAAIWATRSAHRRLYLVGAGLVVLALGNRSPLLYLIITVAVVALMTSKDHARFSWKFFASAVSLAVVVVGIGAYRVVSQDEFGQYGEYRVAIAQRDYVEVAKVSLTHYAVTVPGNAILTKDLADSGALPVYYGSTLLSAAISALPGEQPTLDQRIRESSGRHFIGGGIPPTLAGEGYVNFGPVGPTLFGALMAWLIAIHGRRLSQVVRTDTGSIGTYSLLYGYVVAWALGGQVAGFAGASTFPLVGFVVILLLTRSFKA